MNRESKVFATVLLLALIVSAAAIVLVPSPQKQIGQSGQLASFSTLDEMKRYISNSGSSENLCSVCNRSGVYQTLTASAALAVQGGASTAPSFTTTNIQVQGVDEPDSVKTDGTFLYVASGATVSIIRAYPVDNAGTVATLNYDREVQGLFISPARLTVIENGYINGTGLATSLVLYDTSDPAAPVVMKELTVNGTFVDARMTEGYVYAIVQTPTEVWLKGNYSVVQPAVTDGKAVEVVPPSSVFYTPSSKVPFSMYTMIVSLNVGDGSHSQTAVLTGWGSTVYASLSNVYLAFPDRVGFPIYFGAPVGIRAVPAGFPALLPFWWGGWGTNTTIYKVGYSNGTTQVVAEGTVPGTILNQFSLDEYKGVLRVATTTNTRLANQTWARENNVYVLDGSLKVVGSLQGLGVNENIYSVRFLGDTGYVVTFERIDPLFAISLSDPNHPTLLSALKLTGFSDYLHPIGNGYLIGIGKETIPAPAEAGYVLYQGVKVSLFHVFENGSTSEAARVVVGDRGSDTPVLTDHRAFVYDQRTGLMALPILDARVAANSTSIYDWGTPVFQGAYLYNVTASGGIKPIGTITQVPKGMSVQGASDYYINRIVVVGGYVYTVSDRAVFITDLSTLAQVGAVKLPPPGF